MQQERPQWEKDLPQPERDALDRANDNLLKNSRENPAIMLKLDRIEVMLFEVLTLLRPHPGSAGGSRS